MNALEAAQSDFLIIEELLKRIFKIQNLAPLEYSREEYNDGAKSDDSWQVESTIRAGNVRLIYRDNVFWGIRKGYDAPRCLKEDFASLKIYSNPPPFLSGAL